MQKIVGKNGETVFEAGDKADAVYLIVSGEIGIFLPTNKSIKPDFILGESEIFGEMGVISKALRTGKAVAMTNVNLIKINHHDFNDKLTQADPFISGLVRILVGRMSGLLKERKQSN